VQDVCQPKYQASSGFLSSEEDSAHFLSNLLTSAFAAFKERLAAAMCSALPPLNSEQVLPTRAG